MTAQSLSHLARTTQHAGSGKRYRTRFFPGIGTRAGMGTTPAPFTIFTLLDSGIPTGFIADNRPVNVYGIELTSSHDRDQSAGPDNGAMTTILTIWPSVPPATIRVNSTRQGLENIYLSHFSTGTGSSNKIVGLSFEPDSPLYVPQSYQIGLYGSFQNTMVNSSRIGAAATIIYDFS